MKNPESAELAGAAFAATGCKTREEFAAIFQNAIPLRTLDRWRAGDGPIGPLAQLVLREVADGWRPKVRG